MFHKKSKQSCEKTGADCDVLTEAMQVGTEQVEAKQVEAIQGGNAQGGEAEFTELLDLMESRAETYELLARLYRAEVDEELLNSMAEALYPVESGNANLDEGNLLLATQLSNMWDNTVSDLRVDYARTFIGHGIDSHSAAYPFESVHTSEKRLMMQDSRDEVRALYLAEGLQMSDSWKDGEDHVALELEFMAVLCRRTARALEEDDDAKALSLLKTQRNFMADHLGAWVPLMTEQMRSFAQTDFYRGLSYLTEGFLEVDAALLDDVVSQNDVGRTSGSEAKRSRR